MPKGMKVSVKHTFIDVNEESEEDVEDEQLLYQRSDPMPYRRRVGADISTGSVSVPSSSAGSHFPTTITSLFELDGLPEEDDLGGGGLDEQAQDAFEAQREIPDMNVGASGRCKLPDQNQGMDNDCPSEWYGKTSVMVRNLSYKCTEKMFLDELREAGFEHLIDFVHMPVSRGGSTCKGYAFVNFLNPPSAYKFYQVFHSSMMRVRGSKKPLEVIPSNLQGYAENSSHAEIRQQSARNAHTSATTRMPHCLDIPGGGERRAALQPTALRNSPHGESLPRGPSDIEQHSNDLCERQRPTQAQVAPAKQTPPFCHQCGGSRRQQVPFCEWCGVCFGAYPQPVP